MTLSLPIVVGKKYVRRDGKVITAQHYTDELTSVVFDGEPRTFSRLAFSKNGSIADGNYESEADLVSDYIEPAKGHPHAASMVLFAQDALESETPWDRWEKRPADGNSFSRSGYDWHGFKGFPSWCSNWEYRRRPTITPDPHAENAAEYAKDMAETDKAWERWEFRYFRAVEWGQLDEHPQWQPELQYRRKESL